MHGIDPMLCEQDAANRLKETERENASHVKTNENFSGQTNHTYTMLEVYSSSRKIF